MLKATLKIKNKNGLHARPCALIVERISSFKSSVKLICGDDEADAKSVLSLMTLAAEKSAEVEVIINGEDETEAMQMMVELFDSAFIDAY